MPEATIMLFLVAALALLLLPGPVVLYTITRSLHQGQRAGFISAIAAGVGDSCHVLMAALGLSAILATSALAFSIVKYAGAVYLIYLGVRVWLSSEETLTTVIAPPVQLGRVFSQGFLVSLLNPKTALFFLSFLPQFIDPSRSVVAQTLFLGTLFVGLGVLTNTIYALLAGSVGRLLANHLRFLRLKRYFTGGVYVASGISTALVGSDNSG